LFLSFTRIKKQPDLKYFFTLQQQLNKA